MIVDIWDGIQSFTDIEMHDETVWGCKISKQRSHRTKMLIPEDEVVNLQHGAKNVLI